MVLWQLRTFQETTEYLCLLKIALTLIWNYLICSSIMVFFFFFLHSYLLTQLWAPWERGPLCVLFVDIFPGPGTPLLNKWSTQEVCWKITWGRKGQYLIPLHTLMPGREWVLNVKMNNYRIPRYIPERTEKRCSESCMTMSIGPLFLTDK